MSETNKGSLNNSWPFLMNCKNLSYRLIDVHPKSQNPTSFAFSGCKALTSSLPQKGFWNILYEDAEYLGEVLTELTS